MVDCFGLLLSVRTCLLIIALTNIRFDGSRTG